MLQAPAIHVGDPEGTTGSWLQIGLAPGIVAIVVIVVIGGVDEWMEALSLCLL